MEAAELAEKKNQIISQFEDLTDVMQVMKDPTMSFLEKTRPGPKTGHRRGAMITQSPIVPVKPTRIPLPQSDEKPPTVSPMVPRVQFKNPAL